MKKTATQLRLEAYLAPQRDNLKQPEHYAGILSDATVALHDAIESTDDEAVVEQMIGDYFEERKLDVIALNEAVDRLMALDQRQGLVVTLRFFLGLSVPEVAEALDVSTGTVEGDWRVARAWLRGQLGDAAP